MDNNNPVSAQPGGVGTTPNPQPALDPTAATPAAQSAPAQPAATPSVTTNAPQPGGAPQAGGGGSKKMMFILMGLAVLVIVFGGIYFFMSRQTSAPEVQPQTTTVAPQDTIEEDLDEIMVEDLDADFATIDQDLQGL